MVNLSLMLALASVIPGGIEYKDGLAAKGTTLWVANATSPYTFTKIGKVKSITGPGFSVDFVDTTTHDTVGNYHEVAAVLCSAGDIGFAVNYNPAEATHAPATGMFNQMQNLERRYGQLRFASSDTLKTRMNFAFYVAGHPMTFAVGQIMEANLTWKIDGAITFDTYP